MAATVTLLPSTMLGTTSVTGISSSSLVPFFPSAIFARIVKRSPCKGACRQRIVAAALANHVPVDALSRRQLFTLTAISAAMTAIADGTSFALPAIAADRFPGMVPALLNPGRYGTDVDQQKLRDIVKAVLDPLIVTTPTASGNAGALLRLAFHDAFTRDQAGGGANGSIFTQEERGDLQRNGTLTFAVLQMERALKSINSQVSVPISRADLYQLAGAQVVEKVGGPTILVPIGRSDSTVADNTGLLPAFSNATTLLAQFGAVGLDAKDLVALSGAHTIGLSRSRVAREGNPDTTQRTLLDATPAQFDNEYFKEVLAGNAAFPSDNNLLQDSETKQFVEQFSQDLGAFFEAFKVAYTKLSLIGWKIPVNRDPSTPPTEVVLLPGYKSVPVTDCYSKYPDCNDGYPDAQGD